MAAWRPAQYIISVPTNGKEALLLGRASFSILVHHLFGHIGIPDTAVGGAQVLNRNVQVVDGVLQTVLEGTQPGAGGRNGVDGLLDGDGGKIGLKQLQEAKDTTDMSTMKGFASYIGISQVDVDATAKAQEAADKALADAEAKQGKALTLQLRRSPGSHSSQRTW